MRILREPLIRQLKEIYRKENASKDTGSAKAKSSAAQPSTSSAAPTPGGGTTTAGSASLTPAPPTLQSGENSVPVPVAPHPSDQVTPSSHSPRDAGSSVDQLRSSLRQVADALAQTVAAVRTTREQLLGGREEEGATPTQAEARQQDDEMEMITPSSQAPPLPGDPQPLPPPLPPVIIPSAAPPPTSTSPSLALPLLSTFDGSQESAVATLANTSPGDPFHTFLSAFVGAPPPSQPGVPVTSAPLEVSATTPTSALVATPPVVTTASPRLPIFTQLHQSDSIPSQPSTQPAVVSPPPISIGGEDHTPTTNNLASQVNLFFTQNQPPQIQEASDARTSILTEELARVVSSLVPSSVSSSSTSSYLSLQPLPPTTTTTAGPEPRLVSSGQSPSPSDMLAPLLMASLHMPSSGGHTAVSSAGTVTTAQTGQATPPQSSPQLQLLDRERQLLSRPVPVYPPGSTTVGGVSATPTHTQAQAGVDSITTALSDQTPPSDTSSSMDTTAPPTTTAPGATPTAAPTTTTAPGATPTAAPTTTAPGATPTTTSSSLQASGATPAPAVPSIDPTFLAALPDTIRQEVMAQHEREQRLLRAQREASFMSSISPEFLAALPPNIQEEVSHSLTYPTWHVMVVPPHPPSSPSPKHTPPHSHNPLLSGSPTGASGTSTSEYLCHGWCQGEH